MPDDLSPAVPIDEVLPEPRHVRLVLTVVLDPDHDRGNIHWHVRDVMTAELLHSASWPIGRAQFNDVYVSSRVQKALSDVWVFAGPF